MKSEKEKLRGDVRHFNTPPHVWQLLAKHVFNIERERLIIVQKTCSDTM
jgi:hypothetical protein